ncbi:MAG TPA: VWA domain-containing protein [Thermoanaerobaculia bacterium]
MENLWQKYGGSIQFVAVNTVETEADLHTWLAGLPGGITFPVLHNTDWSIANLYFSGSGFLYFPYIVIIDAKGTIQQVFDDGTLFTEEEMEGHVLDVLSTRDPVDLELVVDVSDTMNDPPPSMPGGDSKLVLLEQAANIVLDILVDHGQANDRVGLVKFSDDVTEYADGGDKLLLLSTHEPGLRGQIDTLTTGTCTAMGAGLQTAFDTLSAEATPNRFAILCTDGMQNIEPKVAKVGGHYEIIDSGGWLCGGHSSVPAHPGVDIATYGTRIHTIGIGVTAAWEPVLQEIADQTGGFYRATSDPATDLALIYAVDLCNCLALGSPAVVRHATGTFQPEQCQVLEHFLLNRSARKLTVALFWQTSQRCSLTFWLRAPDGTLLPLHRSMKTLADRCLATLFLPPVVGGRRIDHVGQWTIVVRGETADHGPAPYQVLVVAEDRETKYTIDYPRKLYRVGDIIPVTVRMPEQVKRITDVTVETIRPRVPFAEMLSRSPIPRRELEEAAYAISRTRRGSQALLAAKLRRIETDPQFRELVLPKRTKTSLGAGTLQCEQRERDLTIPIRATRTGILSYRLELLGESEEGGPVARTDYLSVFIKPGPPHQEHSKVEVIERARGGPGPAIKVTPADEKGHLLGPGLSSEIEITGEAREGVEVHDLLDGTYEISFARARGTVGELSVLLGGEPVWTGQLE